MKTTIKSVLLVLCLPFITVGATDCVADSKKLYNLMIVDAQKGEPYQSARESMLKELERLGYASGKNLAIKYHSIGNQEGATLSIWKLEKDKKYDAIFLNGTVAVMGFKKLALGDMRHKFVFGTITDPIGVGVIDSYDASPKANFTGVGYPIKVTERLRFIKKVMPKAQRIGLIYADMPQSHSYKGWVDSALASKEFAGLQVIYRVVPFVKSEEGHRRMADLAVEHIKALDSQVDVFMSPNDQMGVQAPFAGAVYKNATKPLVGLGKKDVTEGWGATMAMYPDMDEAGKMSAVMIKALFEGRPVKAIYPRWAPAGFAFDMQNVKRFNIDIPADLLKAAGKDVIN